MIIPIPLPHRAQTHTLPNLEEVVSVFIPTIIHIPCAQHAQYAKEFSKIMVDAQSANEDIKDRRYHTLQFVMKVTLCAAHDDRDV